MTVRPGSQPQHWEGDGVQNGISEQTPVDYRKIAGSIASAAAVLVVVLRLLF